MIEAFAEIAAESGTEIIADTEAADSILEMMNENLSEDVPTEVLSVNDTHPVTDDILNKMNDIYDIKSEDIDVGIGENISDNIDNSDSKHSESILDKFNELMNKESNVNYLSDTDTESNTEQDSAKETAQNELTDEEKQKIKEETGWSDEIIDAIKNMDQYEVYKNADLHEAEVNGRKCLLKDIDPDYVDPKTGKTNRELMAEGKSPIDSKTGEKIELHHMGQDFDGPFAELTENSEHGDGNHKTLHTSNEGSWRNDPDQKNQYQREKAQHWKTRAQDEV